jgi:hypothetical protein
MASINADSSGRTPIPMPSLSLSSSRIRLTRKRARKQRRGDAALRSDRPSQNAKSQQLINPSTGHKTGLVWVFLIFLIHSFGLLLLFNPIAGFFDRQPVIEQDWGLHFYQLESMQTFWERDKMLWGYNPLFMAGYPSNTIQDLSIKFFELSALILSTLALSPIQWFKISAFLAVACVPWFMYFAARNLFFDRDDIKSGAALVAALLGTAYWWNSLPREMFFYGMVGYAPAAYTSVLGVTLLYRIAKNPSLWSATHLGWLILMLAIPPLHLQSVVIFLPPTIALLLQRDIFRRNLLIWTVVGGALSILVNLPWLAPAYDHRADGVYSALVDQLPLFISVDPFTFLKDYLGPAGYWTFRSSFSEKGLRLMLLLLGAWGTWKLVRSENRAAGVLLAGTWFVLFLFVYFGSLIPFLKSWQPLRFKVPLDLLLALAASYSVAHHVLARRSLTPRSYVLPIIAACGLLAFLVNLFETETRAKMLLRTRLRPELTAIVEWVETSTPTEGRVLFEESGDETGFVYDGTYLSSFIPQRADRQLIGGPINVWYDRHHFAEFHSGRLFKREIQTVSDEEIKNYFRLYNIGAVVAFHPPSIQRLQSIPGLVELDRQIGPIHLMKVNQPLTWFLQGEGKVKASLNRLELSELEGKEIVLKYHWTKGLSASPPATIAPVKIDDDPIPFIKIIQPPTALTLRIGP